MYTFLVLSRVIITVIDTTIDGTVGTENGSIMSINIEWYVLLLYSGF